MTPHWLVIVVVAMLGGNSELPPSIATIREAFSTRDLCEAAERKLLLDLGKWVLSHQCALATAGGDVR
jgi:hypothetical protein